MGARGIFVTGVGRSGTSALTRMINLMGVATCAKRDLMPAGESNETGFWESMTVTRADELLLALADGRWWCPPDTAAIMTAASAKMRDQYAQGFRAVHPSAQWICKDPRLCFTMPFWNETLRLRPLVLIVCRHPRDTAASVLRQFELPTEHAVALWERSLRVILQSANGLPTIIAPAHRAIRQPYEWCLSTSEFLRRHGFRLSWPARAAALSGFLNPKRLHNGGNDVPLSQSQQHLWELLESLFGYYDLLPTLNLEPETSNTAELFHKKRLGILRTGFPEFRYPRALGMQESHHLKQMYRATQEAYEVRRHHA